MIATLPLFHRIAGKRVIVLGAGEAAQAKRRLVERAGGEVIGDIQAGIAKGARLAFVAYDDPATADSDALRLRYAGVLVNAADRPDLCDFVVPSILDRFPVQLAIGTGGASAGLAKALRLRLETLLPQSLGGLAEALAAARTRLRARWPDAGARRQILDAALGEGGALDPLDEASAQRLEAWLNAEQAAPRAGVVEIALHSDDPDDLTLRQARWLGSADVIAHEPAVPSTILERARADAARVAIATGGDPPLADGRIVVLRRSVLDGG